MNEIKLNLNQKHIVIGTLLGDATIATRDGRPILRLKFEQQTKFKPYMTHLYQTFKPYIGQKPAPRWNKEKTKIVSFWVATYTRPCFAYYYNLFYKTGRKRVPKQIHKLLNPRVLAYWFMDDGTCKKLVKKKLGKPSGLCPKGRKEGQKQRQDQEQEGVYQEQEGVYAYGLSTQGFPYSDQQLLVKALKQKFGFRVTINKSGQYYKLYISVMSSDDFRQCVQPYILPIFQYKLGV